MYSSATLATVAARSCELKEDKARERLRVFECGFECKLGRAGAHLAFRVRTREEAASKSLSCLRETDFACNFKYNLPTPIAPRSS